ncbi:amino acid adenylation domain-containing protein [Lentzea sp. NPDC051213]|uniref:amino acid adenylation domain-containing protein n=1 Tax=Lentzea sp. NPDC051213 TaxID=3364126 RepID=UPI0037B5976F
MLIDVLLGAADSAPEQQIIHLGSGGAERTVTFRGLRDQALRVAASLRARGLRPGTPVIIRTDDDHDFLVLFWAAVAAGVVPVPLPAEQGKLRAVAHQLGGPPVLGSADMRTDGDVGEVHRASADDVAFLQFSSGSTGAPKGVRLTHANVLANLDQAGRAGAAAPDDVVLTWMPYFHDMGLIGTHLTPMAHGLAQVRIPPMTFARNPALWFEAAARYRASVLSAANFALAHAVRRVPDDTLGALDLSAVRLLLVGAEPISPVIWRSFVAKTAPAGLDPRALQPVYGLAEATLAVTFPPLGELAVPLVLDRAALSRGRVRPADPGDGAVELMDVGSPVPGCVVRVVDDAREVVDAGHVGHVEVSGPNVARGYHDEPEAFADGWVRTGDLGFLRDGRLCVTGRAKDVVFVNGRTFHAADLEEAAAPGEEIVVVGSTEPATGSERIIVFARKNADHTAIAARVAQATGHDDVRVLGVPARAVPRTTSGKARRHELRSRYEAGAFAEVAEHRPAASGRGHTTPTALEEAVREIWADVLGVDARRIGAHDRFLAIGGSSLKAMEVLAKLEERFGTTVPPSALRECDTVSALAGHVLRHRSGTSVTTVPPTTGDTAAVIGLACRFPGAETPEEFWAQLVAGTDSVTGIPASRWQDEPGWGSFLDDPALFDPDVFGITEEEARLIDPHARMLLELAHEALERAGYAGPRRDGLRIGVYAAVGESGYPELLQGTGHDRSTAALVGNLRNLVAARVSQALDLTGPAVAIDTACSSALVALHFARKALADGECDIAVVGGVNLNLTPTAYRLLGTAQALSPTGRCRTFSDTADGFVPGEGGAALVLAPAASARRRGDTLLALVRGSAINNDGSSLSLLAPNPLRQREVIATAYRAAGVDPAEVSYVECHGTGTAIGDPVEVQSLAHTFAPRPGDRPLRLGSVKTNLGHLLNAAAMPSLVKLVLALQHGKLPPSLHHEPPSSRCDLAARGFAVVAEPVDWPEPRIAGVNAFGFGGTNAHAILEAAVAAEQHTGEGSSPSSLLTLSARTAPALRAAALELAAHVRANPHLAEADVCATASTARDDGPHRLAVVVEGDLADRLGSAEITEAVRSPRVAFVFPGQDATIRGLARTLRGAPAAQAMFDSVSAELGPINGRLLSEWPHDDTVGTEVLQPLLVASGVAAAHQLAEWGIRPDAVFGHSVGEVTAACVAGRLTPLEAVAFAAERGRLIAELAVPGAMLAVAAAQDEVVDLLAGELWVAAVNGPRRLVLAGTAEEVERAAEALRRRRVPVRRLGVSHAFHTPLLDAVRAPLAAAASALTVTDAVVPQLSTVNAAWNSPLTPGDLAAHAVLPVLFADAVRTLLSDGYDTVVEIGPDGGLAGLVRHEGCRAWALPGRDSRPLLAVAGRLWERGTPLDRTAMDLGARRVPLPTYPFQRRRFWVTDEQPSPRLNTTSRLERLVWREAPVPAGAGTAKLLHAGDPLATLQQALADPAPLVVVTEDAFVTGARPEQALVAGLLRALPDEQPDRALRIVDLSTVDDEATRQAAIATELAAPPHPGSAELVAWRAGRRLTQHRVEAEVEGPPLRPDGTYLITGGSGGIGRELARSLAANGATVVVAGRSAGHRRCDVTDPDEVDELIRSLPALDGVFHAAGVLRPVSLQSTSDSDLAAVLGPKVTGARLLADALARHGHTDAFVVLLSSVASVVPGLAGAVGPYAAANAYLDAFAAQQRAAGRRFVAVNLSAVTGTGMAAGAGTNHALAAAGIGPLSPADAVAGLEAALRTDTAQVVVTGPVSSPVPVRSPVPNAVAPLVRTLLADALKRPVESIGDDEPFLAMGLDSLTAVDLVKRLEEQLGRTLSHTLFFEAQTLRELAALLAPAAGAFPLTDVQRAFVTTGRLYPDVAAYAYVRQTITGSLDTALLARALTTLAERHPMLRARFTADGQEITDARVVLEAVRLTEPIGEWEERLCNQPIDVATSAPLRAVVAQEDDRAHLVLVAHHAAVDGYSLHLLCRELWLTYAADGREPALGPAPAEFRACVRTADPADLTWWRDQLATFPEDLPLPYDFDSEPSPPYAAHQVRLDATATTALRERAAGEGVSLFHLLLATYARCLARWSGRPRVAVNVARSGRELRLPGITGTVGPLADTLPVACDVEPGDDIGTLARRLRDTWLKCEQHASLSSLDIARLLAPVPGERPRTPAPAGFSFARFPVPATPGGCPADITATAAGSASAATRLSLVGWEFDGALHFSWNAPTSLFRRDTIARFAEEFAAGLALAGDHQPVPGVGAPAAPDHRPVRQAGVVAPTEERAATPDHQPVQQASVPAPTEEHAPTPDHQPVQQAGAVAPTEEPAATPDHQPVQQASVPAPTEEPAPTPDHQPVQQTSVVARIREQCRRTPAAIAVADSLTYGELDRESDAVAARLHAAGVKPGDHVGLLTTPGADTVAALVGILKAGAAWVPLDAEHPPARLRDQVERAGVRLTVRHAATAAAATAMGTTTIDPFSGPAAPAPPVAAHPDAIAYIIFTSGSTGRPKGVPVTHAALVNYLDWAISTFGYHAADRLTATSSICFDASVRQLLAPLLVGATIVPVPREHTRDPDLLLTALERGRVTVWSSVPTLWERLLLASERRPAPPDLTALRWVHVGGEALSAVHVRRWFDLFGGGHRITNLYGPTETTINATCHIIDRRPSDDLDALPIGRPAAGAVLRVEDEELLIGGPGLAGGYLGEPELTAAAFVRRDGRRFYRSGDRVRVNAGGDYEFLGRIDGQVKIRGHRVEPGEIEAALQRHPAVERAVVVPVSEAGHLRLVAHVQPSGPVTPEELRAHAAALLPHHMIPVRFELLTDLPVTAVGKVDRARLAPATATERRLTEVWTHLLGVPDVARDADFFALGGDSILALRMFDELADLPALPRPTAIYRHRTISALAAVIDATAPTAPTAMTPTAATTTRTAAAPTTNAPAHDDAAAFPLTPAQRGFLLADTLAPGSSSWLACLRLRGNLDRTALQQAVDLLVERHPMLRTTFPSGARPPVHQELPSTLRIPIEFAVLTDESELTEHITAERTRRLDPWSWPLLRLTLLRTATDDHTLLVHAHHLIGDGWSAALLTRELLTVHERLRRGEPAALPPLRCTFRDYVHLLEQQGTRTSGLEDYRPPSWPAEHTPAQKYDFLVAPQQVAELRRRAAAHGTATHAPVLAAYHRAIAAATGQDDLVIGVATTGRDLPLPGLTDVFGPCVAAVPLRLRSNDLADVATTIAGVLERGTGSTPSATQFFFTYLDFEQPATTGLRAEWHDTTHLDAPPAGVAVFLAARMTRQGLVVNLRSPAGALGQAMFAAVAGELHRELTGGQTLDAAIVGYLPVPEHMGAPAAGVDREQIRALLFPDGEPRLLERVETPIGVSGFVCLPRFADELADPAAEAARAADLATRLGARSVSLAGNLPARTGYGFAVARHTTANLTTGHAVTAASVALTALAALDATGRTWAGTRVAFLGLGSIGRSALELLLADGPPQSLVLCDVPGVRLEELGVAAELCTATPFAPDLVYTADLIVAAVGAPVRVLDVDRLRPGTVVVDDSFPHCLDTDRALARMHTEADVLICGGGLLGCGPATRTPATDLPPLAAAAHAARQVLADSMASCQLESLLCAADPTLPPVRGLVDPALGRVYRDALHRFGITAAPLHLLHHRLPARASSATEEAVVEEAPRTKQRQSTETSS